MVQNLYKVQIKNSLKLEMYVFCTYKQCTNYTEPIQLVHWKRPLYGFCSYIQIMQKLYKIYTTRQLKQPF